MHMAQQMASQATERVYTIMAEGKPPEAVQAFLAQEFAAALSATPRASVLEALQDTSELLETVEAGAVLAHADAMRLLESVRDALAEV